MTPAGIRAVLATTAVTSVLVHGLAGHGLPQAGDDGMAGAVVGMCLLVATAVAFAAAPKPETPPRAIVTDEAPFYVTAIPNLSPDGRARASPSALQRFRN
jgi:hypothetical protein